MRRKSTNFIYNHVYVNIFIKSYLNIRTIAKNHVTKFNLKSIFKNINLYTFKVITCLIIFQCLDHDQQRKF